MAVQGTVLAAALVAVASFADVEPTTPQVPAPSFAQMLRFEQRLTALESEKGELLKRIEAQRGELLGRIADLEARLSPVTANVNAESGVTTRAESQATTGRRLSASPSSFVAVQALEFHEFPNGHTCPNMGAGTTYKVTRPLDASNAVMWDPSPTATTAETSLASVNVDWSTNEIQRQPAAFVMVHDTSCASTPTVQFNLNVSVPALTLDGFDVAARLAALAAMMPAPLTWARLNYPSSVQDYGSVGYYARQGDIVYLTGCLMKSAGGHFGYNDHLFTMPSGFLPSCEGWNLIFTASQAAAHEAQSIRLDALGVMYYNGASGTVGSTNLCLDGLSYRAIAA